MSVSEVVFIDLKRLQIKTGGYVDSIKVDGVASATFGGPGGGSIFKADLERGEYIVEVLGRKGSVLDAIGFKTSKSRTFGPWGGRGGGAFSICAPAGYKLVGLHIVTAIFKGYHVVESIAPIWGHVLG